MRNCRKKVNQELREERKEVEEENAQLMEKRDSARKELEATLVSLMDVQNEINKKDDEIYFHSVKSKREMNEYKAK